MTKPVPLAKHHNRTAFSCGVDSLDRYLHQQAGQDSRKNVASVYVLECPETQDIKGYYTLAPYSIQSDHYPEALRKKLPRYDMLPAYILGRLAVHEDYRGQHIGEDLLFDALERCVKSIAAMAVVVDAIDDNAVNFYKRYDFQEFPNTPRKLFIPMTLLSKMFKG